MSGFKLNLQDMKFVLAQIKIAEAHAAGTPIPDIWVDFNGNVVAANTPGATLAVATTISPYGLRTVDGSYNNLTAGRELWGAADQVMPRALGPAQYVNENDESTFFGVANEDYAAPGSVVDSDPRTISNLIADMTVNNPAAIAAWFANPIAVAAWEEANPGKTPVAPGDAVGLDDVELTNEDLAHIPNIAPDEGLSASFNAWMTFFGQFFDHGLDLIAKGGNGTVYVPLQPDDPLILVGPDGIANTGDEVTNPQLQFMALTRLDADGGEAVNTTTPFVDQNQTYTSHASHQVFLREYKLDGDGKPVNTGHLFDGPDGNSLPTWADVKAQALNMLGIELVDTDIFNVPLLLTDAYGNFIPHPVTGFAQVVTNIVIGPGGVPTYTTVSGTPDAPVTTAGAVLTNHAFLDDIAHNAVPGLVDHDRNPGTPMIQKTADGDTDAGNPLTPNAFGVNTEYDDELLDRHFITGDGRGNENIGLTAVHHLFHSEHNRQVESQQMTVLLSGDADFINEWLLEPLSQAEIDALPTTIPADPAAREALLDSYNWDGERLFQAARFATEMQYQHLVFEEFARKIQPNIDPFVFNSSPDINPAIFAEFAHTVYRFGHSMLTDNMPRIDENGDFMEADLGLVESFLNPVLFDNDNTMSDDDAAAAIIRGMTIERGNEIDEFLVNSLRSNLLGLPLDLAAINIARSRDAGVPSLNESRAELYAATNSTFLKPYANWVDFAVNLKTTESVINFIAAYGKHDSVENAVSMEDKRTAALELVYGVDINGGGVPADRIQFLTSTGAWTAANSGLNDIDLWIGGLAEKKMPFGGMLGSTFNAIFEAQLENLQDGDRFYYLTRTQGQNLLVSLEQNSFAKLLMANTGLSQPGADGIRGTEDDIISRHIGVDSFAVYDHVLEVNVDNQADYDPDDLSASGKDPLGDNAVLEALGLGKVTRDDLGTVGADQNYIRVLGGEHTAVGGTNDDDTIITDFGDDGIWGDDGDDRIESGAGVDLVNGGAGNDIITDSGDTGDFLKGDEGDDVIANSNGLDIIMGGEGDDVVFVGVDDTEVFAGQGNDFVLGGAGVDLLMGNEGDDWLEGGAGFDTTAGDNSELNFDSKIIGHDVMFANSEEHDHDGESGDDIMVEGESVVRSEGMMGFDWVIHKGVQTAANVDMGIPIFTTEQADILRDRYDKVEAASGWKFDDVLIGDDRLYDPTANLPGNTEAGAGPLFFRDELDLEGRARIAGLDQVITNDLMFEGIYGSDWSNDVKQIFAGGNVLLGGGGSDVIAGKGGNDIIDGDRWLNVRIRLTLPGAENTAANEIATVDSLQHTFGAGAPAAWVGKSLFELMIDRVIVPNQLHIVREVLDGGEVGDIDTAMFWDVRENYTITRSNDGTITVSHTGFAQGAVVPILPNTTFKPISDDTDTLRNIEVIRFGDGAGGFQDFTIGQLFPVPATGAAIISDTSPTEGQLLSVDTSTIADANGLGPFSFQWQRSANGTTNWINVGGLTASSTFTVPDEAGTTLSNVANQFLRVRVIFTDGNGDNEVIDSAATVRPVGNNVDASGRATGFTFTGNAGDNIIVGSNFNDTLRGGGGNDIITGGDGNDTIRGNGGIDTAVFAGAVTDYALSAVTPTFLVTAIAGAGGADNLRDIEVLRIGGADYTVMLDPVNAGSTLNGGAGSQAIFGRGGADTLNGGADSDLLIGGTGNDTVNGGDGDDFIFQGSTDGRDLIDGGDGADTYILTGVTGAETFRIYTRTEALAAGINNIAGNTEIVITRNGENNASIIAQLDNVEEIKINTLLTTSNTVVNGVLESGAAGSGPSGGAGDTVLVIGDFTETSLNYSTITVTGSNANDTIDISGLTSDHRIVFDGNGGTDAFIGGVRPQDVVTGIPDITASGLSAGGGIESDFELMELLQSDTNASFAQSLLEELTMRSGLEVGSMSSMFGPSSPFDQVIGLLDSLDNIEVSNRIVTDYSLV